jgi:ankyrin repeat protein
MAPVKPKTIAKMAASAIQVQQKSSRQQSSLVASPSHPSVESSNSTFGVAQQDDDTMEVSGNPLWALAEAIQCDDVSNVLMYVKQCESLKDFDPDDDSDSRDSSNNNKEVEELYAMLQENIEYHPGGIRTAVLVASASFNSITIVRAILADNDVNGVEWSSELECALDIACTKGHVEIAKLVACVEDGQVSSTLSPSSALRYYCLVGGLERAREILADDTHDVAIEAALLDACRHGRCDVVALLTADARFDPPIDGKAGLRVACANGHVEVVSMLLRDVRLSLQANWLKYTLKRAADAGHCDVVSLLMQDPRVNPGLDKSFALEQYCLVGDVERVNETLDDPGFVNCLPGSILAAASRNGHTAVVKLLLADPRVDPAADDNCAILDASSSGYEGVVKQLLTDPRVEPAARGNKAIRCASSCGHVSVVKLLLKDARVDPSADSNKAIRFASYNGHASVVKLLLADPRVDPAVSANYAIWMASAEGHVSVVKLLLADPRVDPGAKDNNAIRHASSYGHVSVVKLLLKDTRVDPSADGNWAIRIASYNGHANVVKLLLADPRVDPTAADNYAIRFASCQGHVSVVKLLLEDPRVWPSAHSNMAIRFASYNGHAIVVKLLLADSRVDPTRTTTTRLNTQHSMDMRVLSSCCWQTREWIR